MEQLCLVESRLDKLVADLPSLEPSVQLHGAPMFMFAFMPLHYCPSFNYSDTERGDRMSHCFQDSFSSNSIIRAARLPSRIGIASDLQLCVHLDDLC